jgi:ectoine hydroxylase-related dioxygenase (phytanoyl-CoA dioxygenase family)
LDDIFDETEVQTINDLIAGIDQSNSTFRKTEDLFAIRQFLKEVPVISPLLFTDKFISIIHDLLGEGYFVVKSIYFDKPEKSNWFVAWHQDLTISVDKKISLPGYGPWTTKHNQFAVQPPIEILQDNFTIRIHLDDTEASNGALNVIPGSHLKGVWRSDEVNFSKERSECCAVSAGGVMIMRPLLIHSSKRTTSDKQRRVVHIEFSRAALPKEINWSERFGYSGWR